MTTDEDIQILGIQKVSEHDYITEQELKLILCDGLLIANFFEPLLETVLETIPKYTGNLKQIDIVKAMASNKFL